ncbi:MAG: serine hydrolase, partial [Acutalibacteraceae bacterium]|nr:serine hydrolase [Acutalibacteraceae bacterium]
MFKNTTPEKIGIKSENVLKFLKTLEERGLYMHSVILARGENIFCEAYWKPFTDKSLHRMYSTTKSYVGVAVCQLAAEGKLSLDDKIIKFFPDKLPENIHPFLDAMTVRHMLKMQTCMTPPSWFADRTTDRLKHYFASTPTRYPGTGFEYDSEGSFVLGALVERLTGKTLIEYLREKCLDEIGFSKEAFCLQAPGGHTWGDSALLCTSRDQLAFGRLLANGGKWNGKQLLNSELVSEAVSKHTDTISSGIITYGALGYGYQIWRCYDGAFAFYGMHDQLMIYHPKTDITFVCTAGNPPGLSRSIIIEHFYNYIVSEAADNGFADANGYGELEEYCNNLKLPAASGEKHSAFETKINKKKFVPEPNKMGITEFTLDFDENGGTFAYVNEQGKKELKFGRG